MSKLMRAAIFIAVVLVVLLVAYFFWAGSVNDASNPLSTGPEEASDNTVVEGLGVAENVTDGKLVGAPKHSQPSDSADEDDTLSDPDVDPTAQEQTSPRAALYEQMALEQLRRELQADIDDTMAARELRKQALRSPIGASQVSFDQPPEATPQANLPGTDPPVAGADGLAAPRASLPSVAPSLRLPYPGQSAGPFASPFASPIDRAAGDPVQPTHIVGLPQGATETGYSPHRPVPARSPYEVKKGTVIPGIMATGINSDIPGYVTGVVRLDVYDTVTGRHLLIPAGSRIFGAYDPGTAYGQRRLSVVWTHLTFPDGDTLVLEGQQATDRAGQSGFADKRRGHFLTTLAGNLLYTIINTGETALQARLEDAITDRPPEPDGLAASIGQIGSSLGGGSQNSAAALFNKQQSQLKPTLVIRPGYLFNILVARDLVLEPRG